MSQQLLLEMKHVSKSFPGVKALDDVHLAVRAGEVHALLGENGAGKSTLIKILGGIHHADAGEIYIDGSRLNVQDVNVAHQAGISVIHQELALALNMTVAENIFMGNEPVGAGGFIDYRKMNREAQAILDHHNLPIRAEDEVGGLSIAKQQMVEIARALSENPRVIVMDEPTATLTDHEVQLLFATIRELKTKGVGIIYISHRMDELFEIADRVTVLRDGHYVGTREIATATSHQLITMMIGRELTDLFARPEPTIGDVVLEVVNVSYSDRVRNCSFALRQGEILGFFGLIGSGRTELMRLIYGLESTYSGDIRYRGASIKTRHPRQAIDNNIIMAPEDRKAQGIILEQDITFNITITKLKEVIRGIWVRHTREKQIVNDMITRLNIKATSAQQIVRTLSGGNQQKVVIAKCLATAPEVLILDEPTRGVDVGAKKEIYEIMKQLVEQGVSIIMISSELPEVINMSTRVATMFEGRITAILEGDAINKENILTHATRKVTEDANHNR